MIRRARQVPVRRSGVVVTAVAMVAGLMSVAGVAAAETPVARAPASTSGAPQVQITAPSADEPLVAQAGDTTEVSFTANRSWPFVVDLRDSAADGAWLEFADGTGSGTAESGGNDVAVLIPDDLAEGEYDLRVRLFTPGADPGRHRAVAETQADAGLHVETDSELGTFSTDFSGYPAWDQPADWSALWAPSNFYIQHDPNRLMHYGHFNTGGRKLMTPDAVGSVSGDVEVATLVRIDEPMPTTRFQLHLHASGERGDENAYYLDVRPEVTRINRVVDGSFSVLDSGTTDPAFESDRWYHAVLARDGEVLRAKVWPYGESEPDEWLVETTDTSHSAGHVGVGAPPGTNNDTAQFAWFGVGYDGNEAPRAPSGVVPLPSEPAQVTGLTAVASLKGITLRWDADPQAAWFDVERDGAVITDRWRQASYYDPLTTDGVSGTYRVRTVDAVHGPGDWSEPVTVSATDWPSDLLTAFEASAAGEWTTHEEELDYTAALADASGRVAVEEIGRSGQDRSIQLVRVGYPEAPGDDDISDRPAVLFSCNQHGDEPAGREACLIELRELAFSDDPEVRQFLSEWAVLFVPTLNTDGREENERRANGIDTNRDHVELRSPEARALTELIRDTEPILQVDLHEAQFQPDGRREAEFQSPGNLNNHPDLNDLSWSMVTDDHLPAVAEGGFHGGYYMVRSSGYPGPVGLTQAGGARHMAAILVETLRRPTSYRAEETGDEHDPHVRQRRVSNHRFSSLERTRKIALERREEIEAASAASAAAAVANEGPLYFSGSVVVDPDPDLVIDPPCGYVLEPLAFDTVEPVLDAHGIDSYTSPAGHVIPLGQRNRIMVATMFDELSGNAIAAGKRVDVCPEPGEIEPPDGTTFTFDFSDQEPGAAPSGWTEIWRPGDWTVLDNPARLRHTTTEDTPGRQVLAADELHAIEGDVDINAVVRVGEDAPNLRLQLWLRADPGSPTGSETGYYADVFGDSVRLNRLHEGSFVSGSSHDFGGMEPHTWYQIRAQRLGPRNYVKIWVYGEPEPDEWMTGSTPGDTIDSGAIGFGHSGSAGADIDWAFLSVGVDGQPAPQPELPDDY
ncbi:M14 family zinc carboxypeptidase [Phytoactinopolyspora limicola]|uniref:M14 family zinc carboxypeptidase n=1 Tax=Phytoactinopolyspora limicola TaxID=2715536 RepID=UPI00140B997D|nr:M14 family zinc carboxypeptidase [Phytoactinopolyspora limicola]